jgi:hypothetical protein
MDTSAAPSPLIREAQQALARRRAEAGICYRPPAADDAHDTSWLQALRAEAAARTAVPVTLRGKDTAATASVRVAPTLAAHCLDKAHRHNGAALDGPYRLYKVLGALDADGRGWLANSAVEAALTRKESATYLYGRRQLKIMLRRGEGLFWERGKHGSEVRIRLTARAKVVEALGLGRLRGQEVALPLSYLLGSGRGRQATVNAALYTAVHAGRGRPDQTPGPISRATLAGLSGCSPYRQRRYEARMGIRVRGNIRILGDYSDYARARARRHLHLPAYKHIDFRGQLNRHKRGHAYLAARLPNSYTPPPGITPIHSRRQQTLNRRLAGLCSMGSGGSGSRPVRLFHRDAATAVRAYGRDPQQNVFRPLASSKGARLWQLLGEEG